MTGARLHGGRRAALTLLVTGALGLAVTALLAIADARRVLHAYLFAWTYWAGLAVGALLLLAVFHATHARWPVVLRRPLEGMAATLPLLAVLFLPVALGVGELFTWVRPEGLPDHLARLVAHKRPWLNVPFFLARSAVYLAAWIAVAELLLRWSRRQDETAEVALTSRQRRLSAGALPFLGLALSFGSLDWLMSLEPGLSSTAYGLYVFAGAFAGAIAALGLATALVRHRDHFGGLANASHRASLGKLLLAFVVFWFYIAFSRYLVVWIADLPSEVRWWLVRTSGSWGWVAVAILASQFAVPFLLLLSRPLKESRAGLAVVSGWVLAAHVLDVYWLVLPAHDQAAPQLRLADVAAFVGIGGLAAAVALLRLRGRATVPLRDPYLEESLRYAGR